jgi:hypothetical protein
MDEGEFARSEIADKDFGLGVVDGDASRVW